VIWSTEVGMSTACCSIVVSGGSYVCLSLIITHRPLNAISKTTYVSCWLRTIRIYYTQSVSQLPANHRPKMWVGSAHSLQSSSSSSASLLTSLSLSSLSSSCDCWRLICSIDGSGAAAAADTGAHVLAAGGICCTAGGWPISCWGWPIGCWCSCSGCESRSWCAVATGCCCWCISGCGWACCFISCWADGSQLYAAAVGNVDALGILDAAAATSSRRGFLAPPDYTTQNHSLLINQAQLLHKS